MSLKPFVDIYRQLNSPAINGGEFSGYLALDTCRNLLVALQPVNGFRVNHIEVDGQDFSSDSLGELPEQGQVYLEVVCGKSSACRFYTDAAEFLSNSSDLASGNPPTDYYLVKENCYSGDNPKEDIVVQVGKISELIRSLRKLAYYHDTKEVRQSPRLVFITGVSGSTSGVAVLDINISSDVLDAVKAQDFSYLNALASEEINTDPHLMERICVFGNTLAEFISSTSPENAFMFFIKEHDKFLSLYKDNVAAFLSGHSFHAKRQEVAEAKLKLAADLSKVMSDITNKLLGIPVSLGAIIAMVKVDSLYSSFLITVGVLVSSWILYQIILNQLRYFKSIVQSREFVFGGYAESKSSLPDDLGVFIDEAEAQMKISEAKVAELLWNLEWMVWVPSVLASITFYVSFVAPLMR
ncbi:hypothetical protein [Salinicola tamaricis]|uniref:hypothetical protein n=1 Tax=Salinicola tamaricis TaxID=1771309 RepID=UPI00101ADEA8|nr:hypothetical protein [Salinicola tamaricis]